MTTATAIPNPLSSLIAARERGMPLTILISLLAVGAGAWMVKRYIPEASWTYQFLFDRSIVQGVLMVAFAIGVVHLLRRVPAYVRERRALASTAGGAAAAPDTLVGRRRDRSRAAFAQGRPRADLDASAKTMSDHDADEIEATYRVPGDIVQVLPLIGFFGTVLGLSKGLYASYIVDGGTTAQGFAKAIALAFDNTLLGLLLTILLFILHSMMRKRDDALLLRLNLETADAINAHVPVDRAPVNADIGRIALACRDLADVMASHQEELARTRTVFEQPGEGVRTLIETHTRQVAGALLKAVADQQRQAGDEQMQAFAGAVHDLGERVVAIAGDAASRVGTAWRPLCGQVEAISEGVGRIEPSMQSMQAAIVEGTSAAERRLRDVLAEQTDVLRSELRRPRTMTLVEGFAADNGSGRG